MRRFGVRTIGDIAGGGPHDIGSTVCYLRSFDSLVYSCFGKICLVRQFFIVVLLRKEATPYVAW